MHEFKAAVQSVPSLPRVECWYGKSHICTIASNVASPKTGIQQLEFFMKDHTMSALQLGAKMKNLFREKNLPSWKSMIMLQMHRFEDKLKHLEPGLSPLLATTLCLN